MFFALLKDAIPSFISKDTSGNEKQDNKPPLKCYTANRFDQNRRRLELSSKARKFN